MKPFGRSREQTASVTPSWRILEMRHLESLATAGEFAPGRQRGRAKLGAECRAGFGGRNDDDGSLDLKHGKPPR